MFASADDRRAFTLSLIVTYLVVAPSLIGLAALAGHLRRWSWPAG